MPTNNAILRMGHADELQHLVRLMSILGVLITCHLFERDRQSAACNPSAEFGPDRGKN
jgi:hypothetical protein